eukprot:UN03689
MFIKIYKFEYRSKLHFHVKTQCVPFSIETKLLLWGSVFANLKRTKCQLSLFF